MLTRQHYGNYYASPRRKRRSFTRGAYGKTRPQEIIMDHEIEQFKIVGGVGVIGRRVTGEDCHVGAEFFKSM